MNIRLLSIIIFLISINSLAIADTDKNYLSTSIGQFDINDTKDSAEYRIEYLKGSISKLSPGNLSLKPFYGAMINGDDGKYFYSGLRKDIVLSDKTYLTPSFAIGYYDQGKSKDLGYDLEFRSQLEISFKLESMNRIAISINHISNASLGEQNPGVESMVISFIRAF
ncbi:acyloxyacyl hydrolase [Pelagibacterales bacterium]|jgi:lipid A 3-O-deacylase|nr:acyloxyacyl hydrolase [Pelagibacterales bacterium]MDB4220216.1 acyloxyacyl hydrolase [Pelagibacterales bacterium]|tara:strand:+ start:171 stop:671 length:501 start_codon:yes stop_codon:yes gene_type:complete